MSNLLQTYCLKSSFRQVLLVFIGFFVLSSCDPIRGKLASSQARRTFSQWVWQGDSFFSVATEEGILQLKDKPDLWMLAEGKTPLLAGNGEGDILWWGGGGSLYTFPFWNPAGSQALNNPTLSSLLEDKNPLQLLDLNLNWVVVLSVPKKEGLAWASGVSVVSVDKQTGKLCPKILSFQLKYPDALLLGVEPTEKGFIAFWEKEDQRLAFFYDKTFSGERSLSTEEIKEIFPTFPSYSLRSSAHRLLEQIAGDQNISSFMIKGIHTQSQETFFLSFGDAKEELPIVGFARESKDYLAVVSGNFLYSLDKGQGLVTRLDLPLASSPVRYTNLLLGEEGYLLLWHLGVSENRDMIGLMHFPYAK